MRTQIVEEISIAQAKQMLLQAAEIYFKTDDDGRFYVGRRRARPLFLMGPAGIGKTEIVRQVAEEAGAAFLAYSITHHTRQSVIGLPRLAERELGGQSTVVTEYTVSEIVADVYAAMEKSGKTRGILFLDECNCVSETLRPALLQLLQDKSLGPHRLPDGWMLVLAGNPGEYNTSARDLDAVTADRVRMLCIRPDYSAWRGYALSRGIHPAVLSFLDAHRAMFYLFRKNADGAELVTARGWEDLSVMLLEMERCRFPVDLPFVAQYLQSARVATEFLVHYRLYETVLRSGLAEAILEGTVSQTLQSKWEALDVPEQCALGALVVSRLERCCEKQGDAAACATVQRVVCAYREFTGDGTQIEYLLGAITASDSLSMAIAACGCEAYQKAASELYFLDKKLPKASGLKRLPGA